MEIEDFEKMLVIKKHQLDEELAIQADVQWRIVERLNAANATRDQYKDKLAQAESKLASEIIAENPKLAMTKVDSEVKCDPHRIRVLSAYMETKSVADRWNGLYEAWRARGFAIKSLCDLYSSSYFASDSHTTPTRGTLQQNYETLREASKRTRTETKTTRRRIE